MRIGNKLIVQGVWDKLMFLLTFAGLKTGNNWLIF